MITAKYEEEVCVVSATFKSISADTVLYSSKTIYRWDAYDTFSTYKTGATVHSKTGAKWSFSYTLSNGETKTITDISVANTSTYKNGDIKAWLDASTCGGVGWDGGLTYTKDGNGSIFGAFYWQCLKNSSHKGNETFYTKSGIKYVSRFNY